MPLLLARSSDLGGASNFPKFSGVKCGGDQLHLTVINRVFAAFKFIGGSHVFNGISTFVLKRRSDDKNDMDVLIALEICFWSIYAQAFVTDGVFLSYCRKMLSISESIDDMQAYTQLTDHVYHQILYSDAAEVISADKYFPKAIGISSRKCYPIFEQLGPVLRDNYRVQITRKNWSNLITNKKKPTVCACVLQSRGIPQIHFLTCPIGIDHFNGS